MAAHVHLRVEAAQAVSPTLFSQRVTDDFLVTIRATEASTDQEVEHGLLRVGASFSWLVREIGGPWRIETTSHRRDLPRTVTISAVASGLRIGAFSCRKLSHAAAAAALPQFEEQRAA